METYCVELSKLKHTNSIDGVFENKIVWNDEWRWILNCSKIGWGSEKFFIRIIAKEVERRTSIYL